MQIKESYQILGVSQNTDLEEVKKAYRRQAFACHPDLHPDDPQAGAKFQRLNQAYLLLLELKKQETDQQQGQEESQEAYYYSQNGQQYASQEQKHRRASQHSTGSGSRQQTRNKRWAESQYQTSQKQKARHRERYFSQEEILRNILNDPFARQVFEDIFRRIKKSKPELKNVKTGLQSKSLQLPWSQLQLNLSLFSPSRLKLWLRSQLDHEHTIYLHPKYLLPGSSVRFQLQQGPRSKPQTITTSIPQDYQAGRPLRLKGLGRRLGPWRGDLYLRLIAK
ncbi:MAG: DnaJ domain-containing protein [Desulfohalobiaceae bacterium]